MPLQDQPRAAARRCVDGRGDALPALEAVAAHAHELSGSEKLQHALLLTCSYLEAGRPLDAAAALSRVDPLLAPELEESARDGSAATAESMDAHHRWWQKQRWEYRGLGWRGSSSGGRWVNGGTASSRRDCSPPREGMASHPLRPGSGGSSTTSGSNMTPLAHSPLASPRAPAGKQQQQQQQSGHQSRALLAVHRARVALALRQPAAARRALGEAVASRGADVQVCASVGVGVCLRGGEVLDVGVH